MRKLLIAGDPKGSHSLKAIKNGWNPEDITVWENDKRHAYAVRCIDVRIKILLDDHSLSLLDSCTMKFDLLIGNPPYDNQMYRMFLEKIANVLDENGKFDLLLPVYSFTKANCIKIFKNDLKLESVDISCGKYFVHTVDGAWIARFRGRIGKTDTFNITFPNGEVMERTLDDVNPTGAKFIEHMHKKGNDPMTPADYTIANKVMVGGADLIKHKKDTSFSEQYVYLSPVINQMTRKRNSLYPGAFALRGLISSHEGQKDGYVMNSDDPQKVYSIYCESKLFVYLYWSIITSSIYADSFIKLLPDVTNLTYENEADLYKQFNLTDDEITRIESILG